MNNKVRQAIPLEANLQDLRLPAFIEHRDDGLYIDLTAVDSRDLFIRFVDRIYSAGAYFLGLEHATFERMLKLADTRDLSAWVDQYGVGGKKPLARLASSILPFASERRGLYRGYKVSSRNEEAEYLFEPLVLEEPDPNGALTPEGEPVKRSITTQLDLDEFVADAWLHGIRFGLDIPLIAEAIRSDKTQRLVIARSLPPTEGADASLEEQTKAMHRDNSPRIRPDGKVDLSNFKNRFPQVEAGAALLKKRPRALGQPGWDVAGKLLECAIPKDFPIDSVAGPGTRIERNSEGEFLIAAISGFISIDSQSAQVSVTEKIINRAGVSARTTGNLVLQGEAFEEHGEVQEKREVRGHDMCFMADVFGRIHSDGGEVLLKKGLSGGSITNTAGGRIVVEASVSMASITAPGCSIALHYAENSLVIGREVRIERAVNCEILADQLDIGEALACALAARQASIGTLASRRETAATLAVLLPDLSGFAKDAAALEASAAQTRQQQQACAAALQKISENKEMRTWLMVGRKLKAGEISMSGEQQQQWLRLQAKVAPLLREMTQWRGKAAAIEQQLGALATQLASLNEQRQRACADIRVQIERSQGEASVHTLTRNADAPLLHLLPPRDLRLLLRQPGLPAARLLEGSADDFSWSPPQ